MLLLFCCFSRANCGRGVHALGGLEEAPDFAAAIMLNGHIVKLFTLRNPERLIYQTRVGSVSLLLDGRDGTYFLLMDSTKSFIEK